jgi:hypothetical protein
MKTKVILFLIFCSGLNYLSAQTQHALGMPEYNALYDGYKNKVFVASKNGKVINPKCQNAEIVEDNYNGRKCLLIKPTSQSDIKVYFDVVNTKGKIIGNDSIHFHVRPLPNPIVLTSTVSKGSGSKITIGQSADSPITIEYSVISIEVLGVNNGQCSGNIIPASLISEIEVGNTIGINVMVRNKITGVTMVVPGMLNVTN